MKERLITLLLAAGALLLFYVFLAPKPAPAGAEAALPLSTESAPEGYRVLWRWLSSQHVPEAALRDPYTHLAHAGRAPFGNLLVTTLPHRVPPRNAEIDALNAWVAAGNSLLIMAALDDTPRWSLGTDAALLRTLGRMTRLNFAAAAEPPAAAGNGAQHLVEGLKKLLDSQRLILEPSGHHPLFAGVRTVLAVSEFPASRWHAEAMDAHAVLTIGVRSSDPAVWLQRAGAGQVIIFGAASPFSNVAIAADDNAQLFANIVAWTLGPGGAVIFDDAHQGAVSYYDAKAFFRDPRLHRTLLWLTALWLGFVLGAQRLRPSPNAWQPADVTGFIRVTGGFFAASLPRAAVAQQLFRNFFDGLRRDRGLNEDGLPVWDELAADARVTPAVLASLERQYARATAGRAVDLMQLHNMLTRLKGTLE